MLSFALLLYLLTLKLRAQQLSQIGYHIPTTGLLSKEQNKEDGADLAEVSKWEHRPGEEKRDWLRRVARLAMAEELCR